MERGADRVRGSRGRGWCTQGPLDHRDVARRRPPVVPDAERAAVCGPRGGRWGQWRWRSAALRAHASIQRFENDDYGRRRRVLDAARGRVDRPARRRLGRRASGERARPRGVAREGVRRSSGYEESASGGEDRARSRRRCSRVERRRREARVEAGSSPLPGSTFAFDAREALEAPLRRPLQRDIPADVEARSAASPSPRRPSRDRVDWRAQGMGDGCRAKEAGAASGQEVGAGGGRATRAAGGRRGRGGRAAARGDAALLPAADLRPRLTFHLRRAASTTSAARTSSPAHGRVRYSLRHASPTVGLEPARAPRTAVAVRLRRCDRPGRYGGGGVGGRRGDGPAPRRSWTRTTSRSTTTMRAMMRSGGRRR